MIILEKREALKVPSVVELPVIDMIVGNKRHPEATSSNGIFVSPNKRPNDCCSLLRPPSKNVVPRTSNKLDPDGKLGLAKPYYEKYVEYTTDAKKFMKELTEAYEYLGYYFMLQKDNAKAKELWLKLKEIDPSNTKAQKALDSLK